MFEYEKGILLRCVHHFKSDLINYMDHIRIVLNPHQWSLAKQNSLKVLKSDAQKEPDQAKAKRNNTYSTDIARIPKIKANSRHEITCASHR